MTNYRLGGHHPELTPIRESNVGKDIESPCISECKLKAEVCTGCGRTRDEIKQWKGMKRREKKDVVGLAAKRLKLIRKDK